MEIRTMFSTIVRRRAALVLLAGASLCLSACRTGVAAPSAKKSPQGGTPPANLSGGGVGQDITLTLPDPKYPGANKLLYYLRAAAADGQLLPDGSFHGTMTKIWARLYQKGLPTAVLTAPQARGGETKKSIVITGHGGVVVKSLVEAGTLLTADTVVWYVSSSQIVATGHVHYHGGKNGMDYYGPLFKADTKLQSIHTGPGHMTGVF